MMDFLKGFFASLTGTPKPTAKKSSRELEPTIPEPAIGRPRPDWAVDWDRDIYGHKGIPNPYRKKTYDELNRPFPFNFIPSQQANKNVRTFLLQKTGDYEAWKTIRDASEAAAEKVCQACGMSSLGYKKFNGDVMRHATECHEEWKYVSDDQGDRQELSELMALCVRCHMTKHLDQHRSDDDYYPILLRIYRDLNGLSKPQALADYRLAIQQRNKRLGVLYRLDMSLIGEDEAFDPHTPEFLNFLQDEKEGKFNKSEKKTKGGTKKS